MKLKQGAFLRKNRLLLSDMSRRRSEYSCSAQQAIFLLEGPVDWPLITISIVTFNSEKWIKGFVDSIKNQKYPLNKLMLVFVDHGSSDLTWSQIQTFRSDSREKFADIQCYKRPNNGFGDGHDFVISKAVTNKVLVTNVDLVFLPDTLIKLVACSESDASNVASWEASQLPFEHPKYYDPVTLEVEWSSHACILIDREKYLLIGGYEKRFFMYGEDVELSYRFRSYGYILRYVPHAKVFHYTYAEAREVKALQFSGSTFSNICIRLRYGTLRDVIVGYFLQLMLLFFGGGFPKSRRIVMKNILKSLASFPAFYFFKNKRQVSVAFHKFDYGMVRDGAFYELSELKKDSLPVISIVTRTTKGRGYLLKECVASVLNQTYPKIEHVIVEDGGDSSSAFVEIVAKRFNRNEAYQIKFLKAPKKGRSHAGNLGLEAVSGDYIVILDDDDLVYPDHVEVLYNALLKKGCDATYSLAWEVLTQFDGNSEKYKEEYYQTSKVFYQEFDKEKLFNYNYLPIQSVLFSKNMYESCGGFDEDMDCLEDWNLWCRYAVKYNFSFVEKTTSIYRTPAEIKERIRRRQTFIDAYDGAKNKLKLI